MPSLILGPVTGLATNRPALHFASVASQSLSSSGALVVPQTLAASFIIDNVNTAAQQSIFFDGAGIQMGMDNSGTANQAFIWAAGATASVAASDASWHAFIDTFAGSSSEIYIDGAANAVSSPGTNGFNGNVSLGIAGGGQPYNGNLVEGGVWPSAISNKSGLNSNQHSYWGF